MAKVGSEYESPRVFQPIDDDLTQLTPSLILMKVSNFRSLEARKFEFEKLRSSSDLLTLSENRVLCLVESKISVEIRLLGPSEESKNLPDVLKICEEKQKNDQILKKKERKIRYSANNHLILIPKLRNSKNYPQKIHSCRNILEIDRQTLLLQTAEQFYLIDQKSGELIDSQLHNLNLIYDNNRIKIDKDILVVLSDLSHLVDIYQILESRTPGGPTIKRIDSLDFDHSPEIGMIDQLRCINKLSDEGVVQVFLYAWIFLDEYKQQWGRRALIAEKRLFEPKRKGSAPSFVVENERKGASISSQNLSQEDEQLFLKLNCNS